MRLDNPDSTVLFSKGGIASALIEDFPPGEKEYTAQPAAINKIGVMSRNDNLENIVELSINRAGPV